MNVVDAKVRAIRPPAPASLLVYEVWLGVLLDFVALLANILNFLEDLFNRDEG